MAVLQDNDFVVLVDTVDVSPDIIEFNLDSTLGTVETTHGAGVDHVTRGEGLEDASGSMKLAYDIARFATVSPLLVRGTHVVEFGPEGDTVGKPKHVQSLIFTSVKIKRDIKKSMVEFDISFEAAAAPTTDMYAGGVYA